MSETAIVHEERPEIGRPVAEICRALGFEPSLVASLAIEPSSATAKVYVLRNGSKFIDEETNEPAVEEHAFRVSTVEAE
jgi:hypothetical protein